MQQKFAFKYLKLQQHEFAILVSRLEFLAKYCIKRNVALTDKITKLIMQMASARFLVTRVGEENDELIYHLFPGEGLY